MANMKKYKINFNLPVYNHVTRLYENHDGKYLTFAEARKNQWKCEKCSQLFSAYKTLIDHKIEFHSY